MLFEIFWNEKKHTHILKKTVRILLGIVLVFNHDFSRANKKNWALCLGEPHHRSILPRLIGKFHANRLGYYMKWWIFFIFLASKLCAERRVNNWIFIRRNTQKNEKNIMVDFQTLIFYHAILFQHTWKIRLNIKVCYRWDGNCPTGFRTIRLSNWKIDLLSRRTNSSTILMNTDRLWIKTWQKPAKKNWIQIPGNRLRLGPVQRLKSMKRICKNKNKKGCSCS